MRDGMKRSLAYRAILTDTLPYEVPVIFSNDKLHAALSAEMPNDIRTQWVKLGIEGNGYTVPYNYDISKDDLRFTTLSVVHPRIQREFASFYELHSASILSHCAGTRVSLRYPIALASPYIASKTSDEEGRLKLGVAQLLVDEGQPDVSHIPSYFAYSKYNLLRKFISSREYTRLEGRYLRHRTLDISKCFYNIYSHTIGWAVKDKRLSKDNTTSYSFEAEFDKLMQLANYNETNGIVVGPEISRIFAEIILQDVDAKVIARLNNDGLHFGRDYDFRRYVDDYFVFSNAVDTLDNVESALRSELDCYKLYINERKVETSIRPFVTPLSMGRQELSALLRELRHLLRELSTAPDARSARRHYGGMKARLSEIRFIVSKYGISFANISGWVMSRLKSLARRAIEALKGELVDDVRPMVADVVTTILEQSFYICSIDFRVRSTYSIAQLCLYIKDKSALLSDEQQDLLAHIVMDNCSAILRSHRYRAGKKFGKVDSIEVFNLLIVGSLFVGEDFLRSSDIRQFLTSYMQNEHISYFSYITLKFCFLRAEAIFRDELTQLNELVETRLLREGVVLERDTEDFLLLQDFISAPDIDAKRKRDLLNQVLDTNAFGHKGVAALAPWVGFVDWDGLSVHHLLAKKELRPVYAWG